MFIARDKGVYNWIIAPPTPSQFYQDSTPYAASCDIMVIALGMKIVVNKRGNWQDVMNEMIVEKLKYSGPLNNTDLSCTGLLA